MGRCGDVGDELGSQLVAARLVRELMRLSFFIETLCSLHKMVWNRLFAPQIELQILRHYFGKCCWRTIGRSEKHTSPNPTEKVAHLHNQLGITEPLASHVSHYYERPYLVIHGERYVDAIMAQIQDPIIKQIPNAIGSINQVVDSTDILTNPSLTKKWQAFFLEE